MQIEPNNCRPTIARFQCSVLADAVNRRRPMMMMTVVCRSEPPGAPRNLQVTDITTTAISLGWEPPLTDGTTNDVTQYNIDLREERDADYAPLAKVSNRITSYTVEELHRGRLYRFRVRSKNAAGYSENAAELDSPVQLKALGTHTIVYM